MDSGVFFERSGGSVKCLPTKISRLVMRYRVRQAGVLGASLQREAPGHAGEAVKVLTNTGVHRENSGT